MLIRSILKRFVLWNMIILLVLLIDCKLSANPFKISLPIDTIICYNSDISITAVYQYNSGPVKWKWQNGDSTQIYIKLLKVKNITTIFITAWDSAGNISSDTMKISIKSLPNIVFSTVPGSCANDTALIDLDNFVKPKGGNWYMDSTFLSSSMFSPKLSKDGYFWPRYDYTDPVTGCSDTDYISVVVYRQPVSSYTAQPVSGNMPLRVDFTNNSIPVSGNFVQYLWDFGDGQHSSVKNPTHIFSTPGNINVCLNVVDTVTKCSDVNCKTIQILPYTGYLQFAGYVYAGTQKSNHGKVYLYQQLNQSGNLSYKLTDSTNIIDSNGSYRFNRVDSGIYLVKAVLDHTSSFYETFFPTYYGDVIFWKQCTLLNIVSNFYGYDIHLAAANKVNGTGSISGKTLQNTMPVQNIQVMLTDQANKPVIYDFSKADGTFNLKNIGYGSYYLYTELTGITSSPMELTIDAVHLKHENFFLEIMSQIGIEDNINQELVFSSLFPNPVEGNGILYVYSGSDHFIEITILDINGKIQFIQKGKLLRGENLISLKTDQIESGVYIYIINIDEKFMLREKLLKIK
jgi:PKD repeat protein